MDKNKLGIIPCIAFVVGGSIGSAIFSLSGMTIYYAGPAAIFSWILAAVIMGVYAMQVAELASRYPKSGGIFVFPKLSIGGGKGELLGFISAWGYIISNIIAISFSAIYVSTYLGVGISAITNDMQIPFAILSILFCLLLNLIKINDAGRFNNILVVGLVLTIVIYSVVAIFGGTFNLQYFTPFFTQGIKNSTGFISAIPIASVAYGSCISIAFMVEEIKKPNKTIPIAMGVGLVIVMFLYLIILIGTIGNLDINIIKDDNNAFYRYVPIFAVLWTSQLSKYAFLSPLISISALLALITTMLVLLAINARTLQAVAKSGYFHPIVASENKNGVPSVATIIIAIISIIICFKPDWTEIIVGLGALFNVFGIIITCYSLIVARKKMQITNELQYKALGGNIVSWITIFVLVACYVTDIISGSVKLIVFTLIIYGIGFVIYLVGNLKK